VLLAIACLWVGFRLVILAEQSGDPFATAISEREQFRIWYPVEASALTRLSAAIWPRRYVHDQALATAEPVPVLIYFGGWPGTGVDNHELLRTLVGQGYVVVTEKNVMPSALEPAESERPMDFSSAEAYEDTLRRADTRVRLLARTAVAWLDSLESLNQHDPLGRFTGRLDLARVGVLGYSFGGAVAAEAAWLDPRFRAVVNLDGWSFGDAATEGIHQPYLFISDDSPEPTSQDLNSSDPVQRYTSRLTALDYPRLLHNLARNGGNFLRVAGTRHPEFVDRGRRSSGREILGLPPDAAGRLQAILQAYVLAFFQQHLRGIESGLLRGPSPRFPEVRFHDLEGLQ